MNILDQLNAAVDYIERSLAMDYDIHEAARRACVSADAFRRFFSYITGMPLSEYVRRRRLSVAADDLRFGDAHILDIALKYGYDSADAFSRAFARQHGITPSQYRKNGGALKIYPPVSFHITVKGAMEMDFRIVQLPNIEVYGLSMAYAGPERSASAMEKTRHMAWSEHEENFPAQICEGAWNQPGNHAYDGVWYGIWQDGKYMIAREGQCVKSAALERRIIHAGTYAAFKTQRGALAWEALPKLYSLIFESWLPSSNYTWTGDVVLERLHLWTDQIARREKRYYELLIPVSSK